MTYIFKTTNYIEEAVKKHLGFPELLMMENAALSMYYEIEAFRSLHKEEFYKVLILCGQGNNGADGYALLRHLNNAEAIEVLRPKSPECKKQRRMASLNHSIIKKLKAFNEADYINEKLIIVDCIFGTGFHGAIEEDVRTFMTRISVLNNKYPIHNKYIIACDIPSGLDKYGRVYQEKGFCPVIKADLTITMGFPKTALYSDAAKDYVGRIKVANIGFNQNLMFTMAEDEPSLYSSSDAVLYKRRGDLSIVRKSKNAHKGTFGHVSVIMGEKAGACIIASTAAFKTGCGLVTIVKDNKPCPFTLDPMLMVSESIPPKADVILMGPGLGRDNKPLMERICNEALERRIPMVLDADMFYYDNLKKIIEDFDKAKLPLVLTPHPKELMALIKNVNLDLSSLGLDIQAITLKDVIDYRFDIVQLFGKLYNHCILVSKGCNTYIKSPVKDQVVIYDGGNVALSKAGSGDVLAGIIASCVAQRYCLLKDRNSYMVDFIEDEVCEAVYLHGEGSNAFKDRNYALTPMDLIEEICKIK